MYSNYVWIANLLDCKEHKVLLGLLCYLKVLLILFGYLLIALLLIVSQCFISPFHGVLCRLS